MCPLCGRRSNSDSPCEQCERDLEAFTKLERYEIDNKIAMVMIRLKEGNC